MSTNKNYEAAKKVAFDLIEERMSDDKELLNLFRNGVKTDFDKLRASKSTKECLRGIIGFSDYDKTDSRISMIKFVMDSMHDLYNCIAYRNESWYQPRFHAYHEHCQTEIK